MSGPGVFDATPTVPSFPGLGDQPDLLNLTSSYESSSIATDPNTNDRTQAVNQV